jgi:hypothetical protein
MPACIIDCAAPKLRKDVDFPPSLAPVMTINDFASASMSLPATGLLTVGHSPTSRRSRQHNYGAPVGVGSESRWAHQFR